LKVRIPVIPRGRAFKKRLRDMLMKDDPYAARWVDAVIRTAISKIPKLFEKLASMGMGKMISENLGGKTLLGL
jgi:hypothetical protein